MFHITDERQFEEDAIILKVIEGYCLSVNARFTVHSGESNCKFLISSITVDNVDNCSITVATLSFYIMKKIYLFF